MQTGKSEGMLPYDTSIEQLVQRGMITKEMGLEFLGKAEKVTSTPAGAAGPMPGMPGIPGAAGGAAPATGMAPQPPGGLGGLASKFKKSS
jgi:hypothetical protein